MVLHVLKKNPRFVLAMGNKIRCKTMLNAKNKMQVTIYSVMIHCKKRFFVTNVTLDHKASHK